MKRKEAIHVSNATRERFEKTRDLQWKMNVSIWTLISGAIYLFSTTPSIRFKNVCLLVSVSLIIFINHFFYSLLVQRSLEINKRIEEDVYRKLNSNSGKLKHFDIDIDKIQRSKTLTMPGLKWILFQISATLILLFILVLINLRD